MWFWDTEQEADLGMWGAEFGEFESQASVAYLQTKEKRKDYYFKDKWIYLVCVILNICDLKHSWINLSLWPLKHYFYFNNIASQQEIGFDLYSFY